MSDFAVAFPNTQKTFLDGPHGVRVPVRDIALENGASSIRVYDTSGPQGHDVKAGLPQLREPWVSARLQPSLSTSDATAPADQAATASDNRWSAPAPADRLSAKASAERCVTQLHYARKGEITPEMELVAVREGA